MKTGLFNILLLLMVNTIIFKTEAQVLDDVHFDNNSNFTYCYQSHFDVLDVTRYYNIKNSSYYLNFTSISDVNITNLNTQGTTYSASMFELRFGFKTYKAPAQQFCLDIVGQQCPISPYQNFTIQKVFNLSDTPFYPLADITSQYSAIDPDSNHLVCIKLAPIGYQHPTWQKIFTFIPIGITAYAAIISIITSFTRFHLEGEYDPFLFTSNDIMLPGVLRLKTPGFFDLVFYSQFIVISGLFNLNYPRFFPLFISNFSWSFLLFDSEWLKNTVILYLFPSSSSAIESVATVPHQTLYKRQSFNDTTTNDIGIINTGMLNFSNAAGLDINSLFFIFLVYFLIIIAACLLLCFVAWIVLYSIGNLKNQTSLIIKSKKIWDFSIGIVIRVITLFYLPMLTLSFYQLMIETHWYITLSAALLITISLLLYGFISIKLFQIRPASFIFTELKLLLRYGSLYNPYTDDTFHFYIAVLLYQSLVAAMIGLFQTSGITQLILVIIAEVAFTLGIYLKWPHPDSQVNIIHMFFGSIKTILLCLNISYIPQLHTTTMVKQYIGYIQMSMHCLVYFLFLLLLFKNSIVILTGLGDDELDESGNPPARMVMWRKRKRPKHQLNSSANHLMSFSTNQIRSQSNSFYLDNNQTQDGLINTEALDALANYYSSSNSMQKPDEIKRVSIPLLGSAHSSPPTNAIGNHEINNNSFSSLPMTSVNYAALNDTKYVPPHRHPPYVAQIYLNNIEDQDQDLTDQSNPTSNVKRNYKLDDKIIPVSEPLMASINFDVPQTSSARPPPILPKHEIMPQRNESNISSIYSPPHQPSVNSMNFRDEIKE